MDRDDVLLSFDEYNPCWTSDMLVFSGMEGGMAETLRQEGFLLCDERDNDVYFLSEKGVARFEALAEELFLPLKPGIAAGRDVRREAQRSFLQILLDKRHVQRRGIKEYVKPFIVELPALSRGEIWRIEGKGVSWLYPEAPFFRRMSADFPDTGWAARKKPPLDPHSVSRWLEAHMPERRTMEADLLYKCRYDFQLYTGFPNMPGDVWHFLNTDRFLFFLAPDPIPDNLNCFLDALGVFQMFLTMMRHLYLPGYVDLDSLEQYSASWMFFAYGKEEDALRCKELLTPFGQSLKGTADPFELWTISLEALASYDETAELISDLLPEVAKPILRVS